MKLRTLVTLAAAVMSFQAMAATEYVMSCDDVISQLNREATAEAKERFADLSGSCLGVVDRDGACSCTPRWWFAEFAATESRYIFRQPIERLR